MSCPQKFDAKTVPPQPFVPSALMPASTVQPAWTDVTTAGPVASRMRAAVDAVMVLAFHVQSSMSGSPLKEWNSEKPLPRLIVEFVTVARKLQAERLDAFRNAQVERMTA